MLSQAQRTAILELSAQKVSKHEIARAAGCLNSWIVELSN